MPPSPIKRRETLALQRLARGMRVEQPHLRDRGRAHEARVFVELRASLHAAGAGDAAGNRISLLLLFGRHARAGAEIVGAVDGNPGFDGFEVLENHAAVGGEIANDGKLGERFKLDRLLEIVDQRGAGHAGASVDEHGAGAADFFEAIRVVGDGRGRLAFAGDGVGGDLHEARRSRSCPDGGRVRTLPSTTWKWECSGA